MSEFLVVCLSNLSVLLPPSGFTDTVMRRSNRTRGAFVSPNHSGLCWKQRNRGGGGERGGRDRNRERFTQTGREREREREGHNKRSCLISCDWGGKRWRGGGGGEETPDVLFWDVLHIDHVWHGSGRQTWARSGHLCVALPACLSEAPMSPGRVLLIPRGCLTTCLSAFNRIYCICGHAFNCTHTTKWKPYGEKPRTSEWLIEHCCWRERRTSLQGQMTGLASGHQPRNNTSVKFPFIHLKYIHPLRFIFLSFQFHKPQHEGGDDADL